MAKCKYCEDEIGFGEFLSHMWDKHRDISEQIKQKAVQKRQEGAGKRAKGQGGEDSGTLQSVKPAVSDKLARSIDKLVKSLDGPAAGATPTKSIDEAVSVVVTPHRFEMSSTLLWQAMLAAIREWNWPKDITPGDFIDTFLFVAFQQRGILLGGYTVLDGKEGKNGNNEA